MLLQRFLALLLCLGCNLCLPVPVYLLTKRIIHLSYSWPNSPGLAELPCISTNSLICFPEEAREAGHCRCVACPSLLLGLQAHFKPGRWIKESMAPEYMWLFLLPALQNLASHVACSPHRGGHVVKPLGHWTVWHWAGGMECCRLMASRAGPCLLAIREGHEGELISTAVQDEARNMQDQAVCAELRAVALHCSEGLQPQSGSVASWLQLS